tara:strand:+ start:582 stop:686 length:105 start_codon:yes stop_codon:yes gene_type:complete
VVAAASTAAVVVAVVSVYLFQKFKNKQNALSKCN